MEVNEALKTGAFGSSDSPLPRKQERVDCGQSRETDEDLPLKLSTLLNQTAPLSVNAR
jgi:hypothetical protein